MIISFPQFLISLAVAFGIAGFVIPLLFDRDVVVALAAGIYGIVGLVFRAAVAVVIIRRNFD
ncbi:MAG TPA: hypothetical protein VHN11_23455 [Xanthobacteraceae bacterium]|nr:hypothetical protein [Xanthobacteraceae bacterium]